MSYYSVEHLDALQALQADIGCYLDDWVRLIPEHFRDSLAITYGHIVAHEANVRGGLNEDGALF